MLFYKVLLLAALTLVNGWPDFFLYTPENSNEHFYLNATNFNSSAHSIDRVTIVIIHGFAASSNSDWMQQMKDEFLKKGDFNVIIVDWHDGARLPNYFKAKENMIFTARKLNELLKLNGVNSKYVYCIGHSLGAHACGLSSKDFKFKRITGLDPAGPLFEHDYTNRLNKDNADFVDVINTDGCLGIKMSIGHVNFYPNGGDSQPGCLNSHGICDYIKSFEFRSAQPPRLPVPRNFISCSHSRSHDYYVESMKSSCVFKATFCDSYEDFKSEKCKCMDDSECTILGYKAYLTAKHGDYYLRTTHNRPFCDVN